MGNLLQARDVGRFMQTKKVLWIGCVMAVALAAGAQKPMAKDAHPSLEVATIKPTAAVDDHHQGMDVTGRRVSITNENLTSLIMFAYGVHPKQIVGGPEWMSDRYDIEGVTDTDGDPSTKQFQEILQRLLVERFGLKLHHEKRELSVYTVTVAKGGPKLEKAKDPEAQADQTGNGSSKGQTMKFTSNTMSDFALGMMFFLDRPVVDRTGLSGAWDFTLSWQPRLTADASAGDSFPDLFTAVQEQLGLKLNPVKDEADVVVIDGVARPSAN